MKNYRVEVPKVARDQLEIKDGEPLAMWVEGNQLVIRPLRLADSLPQIKLRWYFGPALVLTLLFYADMINQGYHLLPLVGGDSVASASLYLATLSGLLAFASTFISQKRHHRGRAQEFSWRAMISIMVACGTITAFSLVAGAWLVGSLFHGAVFDIYTAGALIFLVIAMVTYIMINLAMTISPGVITNLMTFMIIGGVFFSMLTNSNKDWWRHNFSFLGTANSSNSWQFNITLIFSAMLMLTLIDYLFVNLSKKYPGWRVQVTRWLLNLMAACLGGVGLFPNDPRFHLLHDRIAMWMVYTMLILVVVVRWMMPMMTKTFLTLSYVIGGVLAVSYIAFKFVRYLSLTAFEMLAFGLAFSWILLLFQLIEAVVQRDVRLFTVELVAEENDGVSH
ncbi:DUF998 domain-containing protein [Limosilactobacillus fermentum]|uniref:DUF998 domain-containing protein n=1 Tax=Limosilactobacillus fermentum TaxID=1613 RepID=UPI001E2BFEAA|nr:DUF998 domain-containing protein [Limosilactobacillus fermentum]MCC6111057.1 DUF998 domain-containing protein [Limosilactobacillus fermentum]